MEGTADTEGFQEPRLLLYSPSADQIMDLPKSSIAAAAAAARRRRLQNQPLLYTSSVLESSMNPPPPTPFAIARAAPSASASSYPPTVPTDIVVHNRSSSNNNNKSSSHDSVVSEITQPIELRTPPRPTMVLEQQPQQRSSFQLVPPSSPGNNRDITEMKQRLAAIKERRARIKGRQQEGIPTMITSSSSGSGTRRLSSNPRTHALSRRELSTIDPPSSNQSVAPFDEPSANKRSSMVVDVDTLTVEEEVKLDFVVVPPQDWPISTKARAAVLPVSTPPRRLQPPSVSMSPKSAGMSTCRTLDETILSSEEHEAAVDGIPLPPITTSSRDGNSWKLGRLLCTSGKGRTSSSSRNNFDIDTELGQTIRSTQSLDVYPTQQQQQQHRPLKEDSSLVQRGSTAARPGLPRAASYVPGLLARDDNDYLVGRREAFSSTSYPRPLIPGKAYSEIMSQSSRGGAMDRWDVPSRPSSSSCLLRKDPWYMTRRMKLEREDLRTTVTEGCDDLLEAGEANHVMHTVVFVQQKKRHTKEL